MKKQYWRLDTAIEKAKEKGIEVTTPTLIQWINKFGIGFQLGGKGGKWYVFPDKFMRYIDGKENKNPNNQPIRSDETTSEEKSEKEKLPKGSSPL